MNTNGTPERMTPDQTEQKNSDRGGPRHYKGGAPVREKSAPKAQRAPKEKPEKQLKKRIGPGQKRWRRLRPVELVLLILPVVALTAAAVVMYFVARDVSAYTVEGKAYQYYAGNSYPIPEDAQLRHTDDGETRLVSGNHMDTLSSLPIYFEDKQVIALPRNMAYYDPRGGKQGCAAYFSELHYVSSGAVTVKREKKEAAISTGFLYDGSDLYLFLEPVMLSFNGYTLSLPSMSYIEAQPNGMVMAFNAETKEFMMEAPLGEALVTAGSGDYTVALLGDSMTDHNGARTLLVCQPDLLDPLS